MAGAVLAAVGSAEAQVVRGTVVAETGGAPLRDVTVRLLFLDGRVAAGAVTDSLGAFRFLAPRLGRFLLSAQRLGLAPVETPPIEVRLSEEVEVSLRVAEQAIPLEPLLVQARTPIQLGPLAGYFQRADERLRAGSGLILSRDEIQERQALDVADLLRDMPRVRVVERGGGRLPAIVFVGGGRECTPKVFLDGIHQNRGGAAGSAAVVDEVVRPHDLEGVEVYRGLSETPGEYYDEGHCGAILLWTRRDAEGGGPLSWTRMLFGVVGALVLALVVTR